MSIEPLAGVPLAGRTTFEVGGPAELWLDAPSPAAVIEALRLAHDRGLELHVLGGGSNVLVADRGLRGLVLRPRMAGLALRTDADTVWLDAGAGVGWDDLVRAAVAAAGAGVECLSGIPGDVGAAPIQNIGAYGQEVADSIHAVRAVDRTDGTVVSLPPPPCAFGYRTSAFKTTAAGRYLIVGVELRLARGGEPCLAYPELAQAVGEAHGTAPTLAAVREVVLGLRRAKSMLLDPNDDNRRSAGSFFVNPTLGRTAFEELRERAATSLPAPAAVPHHDAGEGLVKVPAAWLIERAGLPKGTCRGRVGLSSRHSLAIVNRGGATAAEIVAFAAEIRARVRDRFGVTLVPEPQLLGFEPHELAALTD